MRHAILHFGLWILMIGSLSFTASGQPDPCALSFDLINTPNSPGRLIGQASAYDSRRQVAVLFGGNNPLTGVHYTGDTWEWNGAAWILRTSGTPPARTDAAMAYDSARGVCVLFGGGTNIFQHQIPFNDTWEWDGSVWTLRQGSDPSATDRPPPLDYPKMSYDSARRRMVLLGSTERAGSQVNPVTRTWEWDGNTWSVRPTAPPSRFQPSMAYDPVRRVTVVFGGIAYAGSRLNDTWTWDGTSWTRLVVSGPPPRDEHAMAFDVRRRVMVLFGGSNGGPGFELNDTWEWNGQSWSYIPDADNFGLIARRLPQMWYDTGDQKVTIFGGTWSLRNGDGSYSHFILDELWEGRPPGFWIDFAYSGFENGRFYTPYNSLDEGVAAAPANCTLLLKAGSSADTLTISKQLVLEAYNGPVTIGR